MADTPKTYQPIKSSTLWPATSGDGRGRLYTVESDAEMDTTPRLADALKESIQQMKAIERGEAPPLPVRYPAADFDPEASEFVFETDDEESPDVQS